MTNKEKLIAEIQRVKLVLEQVEYSGALVREAMIRHKLKEAGVVLLMGTDAQAEMCAKGLEGIV